MSNSNYYLGRDPVETLGDSPRFFYALRRNQDGELFLVRSDQIKDDDPYVINIPGPPSENFEDFEVGIDFFEGVDANHELVYENMYYTQYRWDDRPIFYYIDDNGQFVQRLFSGYTYPQNISSNG
jgi:hypothetical protein